MPDEVTRLPLSAAVDRRRKKSPRFGPWAISLRTMTISAGWLAGNLCECRVERGAESVDRDNDRDRNAGRDQAVFAPLSSTLSSFRKRRTSFLIERSF